MRPDPLETDASECSPAVLVVDVTRNRADPDLPTARANVVDAVGRMRDLLETARERAVPVLFTRGGKFYHTSGGAELTPVERGGWTRYGEVREESPETAAHALEIAPALDPRDDEVVVTKTAPSGFFKTMLPVYLSSLGVDTVVIVGRTAAGCVRATVVDAFSHDYGVVVPRECVTDPDPERRERYLADVDRLYARVAPTAAVETWLQSG